MRRIALLPIIILFGCHSDPETGRLGIGSEAITYSDGATVSARSVEKPTDKWAGGWVNAGTRVAVVSDETTGPEDFPGSRLVKVNIKDGARAGEVVLIIRGDLRPVPR